MYTIPLENGIAQEKSEEQKTQAIPKTIHGREWTSPSGEHLAGTHKAVSKEITVYR